MENKNVKKSFVLLTTILLVVLFSFLSIAIVEKDLFRTNMNRLKYLHLQANIHIDTINTFVKTHNNFEILEYQNNWNDTRFSINIVNDEKNSSVYYTSIETVNNSHIRLSQKIIK